MAAIPREEPRPPRQVVNGLPREVGRIVRRCLQKEPARRFQHMGDLKVALEELKEESSSGEWAERLTTGGLGQALPYVTAGRGLLVGGDLTALVGLLLGLNVGGLRDRSLTKALPELKQHALTANQARVR